jgi:hypothetical protein
MDAGGRATHGRQTAPAFAEFSTSCTSAVAETRKPVDNEAVEDAWVRRTQQTAF